MRFLLVNFVEFFNWWVHQSLFHFFSHLWWSSRTSEVSSVVHHLLLLPHLPILAPLPLPPHWLVLELTFLQTSRCGDFVLISKAMHRLKWLEDIPDKFEVLQMFAVKLKLLPCVSQFKGYNSRSWRKRDWWGEGSWKGMRELARNGKTEKKVIGVILIAVCKIHSQENPLRRQLWFPSSSSFI